ncbi:MAG: 4Fe-4S dicluster domain-containing protein [Chloroflexota bacterium]
MRKEENALTRRDFIKKTAGALGLAAALGTPLVPLLGRKAQAETEPPMQHGTGKKRQWCMVIDLKKCDGCIGLGTPPQCVQSCINGHFAPKGQQWIEVFQPKLAGGGSYFLPTPCYQCENAPCVNVCPVAATYQTDDGVVLIDHHRCIGCRMCMGACPYHRRFFNWATPEVPPEAAFADYSPEYPVPAIKGTVIKCMFCVHFLVVGKLPYCVQACPRKVLYMGDLVEDIASNGAEVVQLSRFLNENNAYRYKEELGTQPRVWYLPGYGQEFGRKPDDPRPHLPPVWGWGGDGYDRKISVWPWEGQG